MTDQETSKLNQEPEKKPRFRIRLAVQVAFFFAFATLVTGVISYFALKAITDRTVRSEKEELAEHILYDLAAGMSQYQTIDEMLVYWMDHADELDVEYDYGDATKRKELELNMRHPSLILGQSTGEDLESMSEEDQKMYAEVLYTWIISEFNSIKELYGVDFVFVMTTDPGFQTNTYLFSGATSDMKRSRNYGDAYVVGTEVACTPEQEKVLKTAMENQSCVQKSARHLNCYYYFGEINQRNLFLGVSFNLAEHLDDVKTDMKEGVVFFVMVQIAFSVICLILLTFFIVWPVRRIQKRVRAYKDSKDADKILRHLSHIHSGNELGELKDDIAEYVMELEDYMKEIESITSEQERIRTELSVATKIQADMLPKGFPTPAERKGYDLYATMTPAKEVGGDFYDFFQVDEDHLALVIADVSGKGVPAAMFMVTAMTLIRTRTMLGGSPAEILGSVNNRLCEGNESGFFVTVWLAILDLKTGQGVAANAGHEHPALRRKDGSFELVKYRHSPAVATMEGMRFQEHTFQLEPGDRLYVYTDGVTEATDTKEELFGEERLLAALNRHPEANLTEMLEGVKQEIDAFVGEAEQFDDITMLAVDYLGPQIIM
ncbi:MAG: PP2C family protein-serine/threonine phosphatase [Eubacterium sp.]|nr:PP2C family protein-serine/threonine phosphatase [Eubacterium sp.]